MMFAKDWSRFDDEFILQLVVLILVFLCSLLLFYEISTRRDDKMTVGSIKEALDKLTSGVIFADAEGEIFLSNIYARKLMLKQFGFFYRDMDTLWEAVKNLKNNISQDEDSVITILDGKYYYTLMKNLGEGLGTQLTIADVSEEMELQNEILMKQAILKERNEKIRKVLMSLEDIKREQVSYYMHFRLHDILGQRLSMLERFLNNPDLVSYEKLAPYVYGLTKDIRESFEREPQEILDDLVESFKLLNVDLLTIGGLPENKNVALLFVATLREAATNAVRHGHADTITGTMYKLQGVHCLDINDNGLGTKDFKPGNGIEGMKLRVKQMGGEIFFDTHEGFVIHVRVGGYNA